MITETRETRGLALFAEHASQIVEVSPYLYRVPSCSGGGFYRVDLGAGTCECPDHQYRVETCKHIVAATIYAAKRRCRRTARRPSRTRRHREGHRSPQEDRDDRSRGSGSPRTEEGLRGVLADPDALDRIAERLGV